METAEIVKLIYAVGITGSVALVSFAIYRLLNSVTKNVDDLRKTVKNLGNITEGLADDQILVRKTLENVVDVSENIKGSVRSVSEKVIQPFVKIFSFLKTIQSLVDRVTSRFQ